MKTFTEKTMPVIEKYRAKGMITDIDGTGSMDEVYENLKKAVSD